MLPTTTPHFIGSYQRSCGEFSSSSRIRQRSACCRSESTCSRAHSFTAPSYLLATCSYKAARLIRLCERLPTETRILSIPATTEPPKCSSPAYSSINSRVTSGSTTSPSTSFGPGRCLATHPTFRTRLSAASVSSRPPSRNDRYCRMEKDARPKCPSATIRGCWRQRSAAKRIYPPAIAA